jgi:hypothetical protein
MPTVAYSGYFESLLEPTVAIFESPLYPTAAVLSSYMSLIILRKYKENNSTIPAVANSCNF